MAHMLRFLHAVAWLIVVAADVPGPECTLLERSPQGTILLDSDTATQGTTAEEENCYDSDSHDIIDTLAHPEIDPGDFDGGPDAAYWLNLKEDETKVTISTCHGATSFWTSLYVYSEDGRRLLAGPGKRLWSEHDYTGCAQTTPPWHARKLNVDLPAGRYRVVVDSAFPDNNGTFGLLVTTAQEEDEEDEPTAALFATIEDDGVPGVEATVMAPDDKDEL